MFKINAFLQTITCYSNFLLFQLSFLSQRDALVWHDLVIVFGSKQNSSVLAGFFRLKNVVLRNPSAVDTGRSPTSDYHPQPQPKYFHVYSSMYR